MPFNEYWHIKESSDFWGQCIENFMSIEAHSSSKKAKGSAGMCADNYQQPSGRHDHRYHPRRDALTMPVGYPSALAEFPHTASGMYGDMGDTAGGMSSSPYNMQSMYNGLAETASGMGGMYDPMGYTASGMGDFSYGQKPSAMYGSMGQTAAAMDGFDPSGHVGMHGDMGYTAAGMYGHLGYTAAGMYGDMGQTASDMAGYPYNHQR
jgi:hypothetical protein